MRKHYQYFRKSFNENLTPLVGYLRANVGKPWDEVYAEICQTFDTRRVINNHILEHLFDFVNIRCRVINGVVCTLRHFNNNASYNDRWVPIETLTHLQSYPYFYVDPTDGLLKIQNGKTWRQYMAQHRDRASRERDQVYRHLDELIECFKCDGMWYQVVWAKLPEFRIVYHRPYSTTRTEWAQWSDEERQKFGTAEKIYPNIVSRNGLYVSHQAKNAVCMNSGVSYTTGIRDGAYDRKTLLDHSKYYVANIQKAKYYMVSCVQLSGKRLQQLGLSNDEPKHVPMSHREAAKYRV